MSFTKLAGRVGAMLGSGLLAFAFPVHAQSTEASSNQEEAIALALERGEAIYRHDQAAWHGTDAMLADLNNPSKHGITGWIVKEVEQGHELVFYRPVSSGFEAVWSGVYDGEKVKSKTRYVAS